MNAQNETSVRVNMMHDPKKHRGLCPRKTCEVSSVPINCAVKYHVVVYPTMKLGYTVKLATHLLFCYGLYSQVE